MGVYIKGIEMPTRCGRCDMCVPEADGDIDWHNVCCITGADIVDVGGKMEDCPLVPVPPHGRWNNIIQGIIPSGQCSNCGAWDKVTRFCPNCGAMMEGN